MTAYRIENFFGHLDTAQTVEAVKHGASLLTVEQAIDAVTEGMNVDQLQEAAALIVRYIAELDVEDAA